MNTSRFNSTAIKVEFDSDFMWVDLNDGRRLGVPINFFPRLENATSKERASYEISGGGTGLHWEDLDEDISVKGLLLGIGDNTNKPKEAA